MKNKILLIITFIAAVCTSCSDWLDVQPSDRVSEDNNFSDVAGFKKALNGIYIELNRPQLYGRNLTSEYVEILAQRYDVSNENKNSKEIMQFQYTGSYAMEKASSIWSTAYSLIANANLILKNCSTHRDALPDEYYHLVKGEALALRAYLHFDLFRLFGPIYSVNPDEMSIPYYKEQSFDVASSYSGKDFVALVIADLLEAEKELENDPIIKYGVAGNKKDVFLQYRNLRLNYYAVQALLARVYMYIDDKENAFNYAKKVADIQEEKFPWIDPMRLTNYSNMDRVFSTEILFALQNLEREQIFRSYFDGQNLKAQSLLAPLAEVVDEVFEQDKVDYRRTSSLNTKIELSGKEFCVFNKYSGTDSLYNQMIPMLRISEMYMIAAETATSDEDKLYYFNTFRNHRGLRSVGKWDVDYYLGKEWKKEFYGEGQLFFYYKRKNMNYIQAATSRWGDVTMKPQNYVIPIPDGESKYN